MIVIICLSIAAMLVMPLAGSQNTTKLQSAAQMMVADLQYAQMRSMGHSQDRCSLVFKPADDQYHLAQNSQIAQPIDHPGDGMPYIITFGKDRAYYLSGVSIASLQVGGDDRLGFTALGALDQGTTASITLQLADQSLQIQIDPATGDPRLP